ncbi:MAG: hypothetical protein M0Q13_10110 [Methanothrix sp.]|jgi:hypothetical protein|nr:hypothetical protein [Methanothrix sp.]
MIKVRAYKINEAVKKSNNNEKEVISFCDLAIIVNNNSAIVLEKDACHYILDLPETFKIGIAKKEEGRIALFPESFIYPTVQWILDNVEYEEVLLSEWIGYFGIKTRIIENCNKLRHSIKALGLDPSEYLPKIG